MEDFNEVNLDNDEIPPNIREGQWSDESGRGVSVLLIETYKSGEE